MHEIPRFFTQLLHRHGSQSNLNKKFAKSHFLDIGDAMAPSGEVKHACAWEDELLASRLDDVETALCC
ncbi:hypothetical protein E2C01_079066 [Portunus trituberculatus]|uniref:Uncharacterized protein n=1 Tax=Portunus trituberculatus TaxID=210409 RepID=A0A5B7IQG0_PORTR|nr:hypothetical protein [Portunus trituberculatus]